MGKELVEVIVSQTGDGKVRLGFLATDNVTIDRKEIDDAKQKEKR
jgi:sRNA-binding carbon storage regulator CsrA